MIDAPLQPNDPMNPAPQGQEVIDLDALDDALEVENEDGSVTLDMGEAEDDPAALPPAMIPHAANLADYMSEDARRKLASDLKAAVDSDDEARADWLDQMAQGFKLLGFTFEDVSEPWDGAAAATHPLLAEAVVAFQSRSIKALFPATGPAKAKVRGAVTPFKMKAVSRVVSELNTRLTGTPDYRNEVEKALFSCGLTGSGFLKTYYSDAHRRPLIKSVSPSHLILSPDASDISTAGRVTHVLRESLADVKFKQSQGVYRAAELEEGDPITGTLNLEQANDVDEVKDEIAGRDGTKDQRLVLHEVCVRLKLADFDDALGVYDDPNWGTLPYIVTYDTNTMELLAVYRNWDEQDPNRVALDRYTHFLYIVTDISPYGTGLVHLVGQTAATATSALRNLLDTGTLANMPGGFKARGMRITNSSEGFRPGEFKDVDVASGTLRDNILPHQFKEPSPTLLALMEGITAKGEKLAAVSSASLDDIPHNAASFAVLAVLEREVEPQAAVHVRLHAAMKQMLRFFAALIRDKLPPNYEYDMQDGDGSQPGLRQQDFALVDIEPVSNPSEASAGTKLLKMQVLQQLVAQFPEQFDKAKVVQYSVSLMGEPDFEGLLAPAQQPPSMDPLSENVNILMGKPVKVYPEQDHEAHIRVHMAAMQDPKIMQTIQASPSAPTLMMAAQAHVAEHVALAYRRSVEREMGIPLPPMGQPMPPEIENQLAAMVAEAAERVLGLHQKVENLKRAEDPIEQARILDIQNKARQLDIDEEDRREKRTIEAAKVHIEATTAGVQLAMDGIQLGQSIMTDTRDADFKQQQLNQAGQAQAGKQQTEQAKLGIQAQSAAANSQPKD